MLRPDVLVVGAGPAGIAAAVRAQESGARVTVIDDNPTAGGQIWRGGEQSRPNTQARHWLSALRRAAIPMFGQASVISADSQTRTLLVQTAQHVQEFRFGALVLATGAREAFLPFPGWTLPGIFGVGGLQAFVKSGMPVAGKSIVIAGSGPLMLAVAKYVKAHGAQVKLIAEQAPRAAVYRFAQGLLRNHHKLMQAASLQLSLLGIPHHYGCWVEAAHGDGHVQRVTIRQGAKTWTAQCDFAAIGYGLYPNSELASLLNCQTTSTGVSVDEWQQTTIENIFCAGECTGIGGVDLAIVEGEIAGFAASNQRERARALFRLRDSARLFAGSLNLAFALRPEIKQLARPDTIICRCEDVTFGELAAMPSFQAAKLHTRCGMGACQGRMCGGITELLFHWETKSIRPPIFPARVGSLCVAVDPNVTQEEASSE